MDTRRNVYISLYEIGVDRVEKCASPAKADEIVGETLWRGLDCPIHGHINLNTLERQMLTHAVPILP